MCSQNVKPSYSNEFTIRRSRPG